MKKHLILSFVLIFFTVNLLHGSSPDSLGTQPKNVIYASAGTFGFLFTVSASYERRLFSADRNKNVNFFFRASGGRFASLVAEGTFGLITFQGIIGAKKSHVELGLGTGILRNNDDDSSKLIPAGSLGYRYHKPTGSFVFRTGIGFPEGLYLSLGFAF